MKVTRVRNLVGQSKELRTGKSQSTDGSTEIRCFPPWDHPGEKAKARQARGSGRAGRGTRAGTGAAAGTGRAARGGPQLPSERSAPPSPPTFSRAGAGLRPPAVGSSLQSRVESPVPALVDLCLRKGGCRDSALRRDSCLSGLSPCILGGVGADLVVSRFMKPKSPGGG
ncbi:uncharacterized protein LOC141584198 [Saimiri boliviensis]|uniref:uncharacterized protein LOC141584198 n=1 Tax=Saimiri boliviensis TaxID=27679 RepID=UPI00027F8657